jgi:hypothetical protein
MKHVRRGVRTGPIQARHEQSAGLKSLEQGRLEVVDDFCNRRGGRDSNEAEGENGEGMHC